MMRRHIILSAISLLSIPVLLQSCFTGVESTPKITSSEVRKQHVVSTPEMEYLSDITAEPFAEWLPGKPFYVTDSKIGIIFTPSQGVGQQGINVGDTITYLRYQEALSVTGDSVTDIVLAKDDTSLTYRVNASASQLRRRKQVEIPFTIEMNIIADARHKISDKNFYILTPLWYDNEERPVDGLRFTEVRVTDVLPGNHVYPLKVMFTTADTGLERCVFLSLSDPENSTMRNFAKVFALSDPHLRYPSISYTNWHLIQNSKVALGMTRDECRLALGSPSELDRRPSTAGVYEIWNYDDGQYLIFQDGLLTRFRR